MQQGKHHAAYANLNESNNPFSYLKRNLSHTHNFLYTVMNYVIFYTVNFENELAGKSHLSHARKIKVNKLV